MTLTDTIRNAVRALRANSLRSARIFA